MDFENPGPVVLTNQELEALLRAVYTAQDMYEDALMNFGQMENALAFYGRTMSEDDAHAMRYLQSQQDTLDIVRRRLGDKWEPASDIKVPDDISSL